MISEITRQSIADEFLAHRFDWSGRLDEPVFLARLYDLQALESTDHRFKTADRDIHQHRVLNLDWDDDWIFSDERFDLVHGPDEVFLRFLAETVHPVLRRRQEEVDRMVSVFNEHLRHDGVELVEVGQISGRPVYAGRRAIAVPAALRRVESSVTLNDVDYLSRQITRMESAIEDDPELAIGTAKELVETCCRTILAERGLEADKAWDVPRLLKETAKCLQLTPSDVAADARGEESIRKVLGGLGAVVAGLAELRNSYGTGHGKPIGKSGLGPRHARLAVGAGATLAVFLFDTFEHRRKT